MRKEIAKHVRSSFDQEFRTRCPEFTNQNATIPRGDKVYRWAFAGELSFFVSLQIHPTRDAFTIELAHSRDGQWPATIFQVFPTEPSIDGRKRFRLSALSDPNERAGGFWWLEGARDGFRSKINPEPVEEVACLVGPAVKIAVEKIVVYGIPYFESVMKGCDKK